jgi:hypothetical protein
MVPGLLLLRTWYVFHYLRQHAHLREEQQLQEGSNGIRACPTWCGIGIDVCFADLDFSQMFRSFCYPQVPAETTPPSSRMGVGAIQQLAFPQQILRSITSRAAPPQQDNLDGFSRNMPFPSAFLSTPPATQEIPSTRGKLHYAPIHVTSTNPSSSAVSARTQARQQHISPIPPVTREASSSDSSQSELSIITISVLLILTPILAPSVLIPETPARTLPVSAV